MTVREELLEYIDEDAVTLEGEEFDEGIYGYTSDGRIVYDYDMLVASLVKSGMTEEDAVEWIDFNTMRSLPYMGEMAPVIVHRME